MANLYAAQSEAELHEADVQFHAEIANATGNDLLILTLGAITPLLRRQRQRVWRGWVTSGGERAPIIEAHARILEHIKAHDPEGAAEAMREHLSQPRWGLEVDIGEDESEPVHPGPSPEHTQPQAAAGIGSTDVASNRQQA